MAIALKEIADRLKGHIIGDEALLIEGVSSIDEAQPGDISFVTHAKYEKRAGATKASVLMTRQAIEGLDKTFLIVEDPYFSFAELLSFFYPPKKKAPGIHPSATMGSGVSLGEGVSIGPSVTVEDGAVIGDGVQIWAGVFVGEGSRIGAETILYPNVTIREGVEIGQRVIIHSGTVIGSDGFGFAFHKGKYKKIPQIGGVIIEDDVEIGANVAIDRAAMGQTVIGHGTKLDNLVQVGHNVKIGNDTILVAQVGISGSVQVGHHVTLAGQVGVAGHITIGDEVVAGAKSGLTKDIPARSRVSGFPAVPHKTWLKTQAESRHLPALRDQVNRLSEKIAQLEKELDRLNKRLNKKGTLS